MSGENESGRPILWIREGFHQKRSWAIRDESPEFWAVLRAQIFGFQAAMVEMNSSPFPVASFHFDVAEQGPLDFNINLSTALIRYLNSIFPVSLGHGVLFGSGQAQRILRKLYRKVAPTSTTVKWIHIPSKEPEATHKFVKNLSCIPSYIMDDDFDENDDNESKIRGTPYNKKKNGITWIYKRLTREGYHVTAADVFNPQPYDNEIDLSDSPSEEDSVQRPENAIKTFDESDEDDEW